MAIIVLLFAWAVWRDFLLWLEEQDDESWWLNRDNVVNGDEDQ